MASPSSRTSVGPTAHAYCGDSLRACVGDLTYWIQMPTMEQALRAYIIRSRVRDADNLLLAQQQCRHTCDESYAIELVKRTLE